MRVFTDEYTIVLVTEMITDPVSTKRTASLGPGSVAYIDEGSGPPVLLGERRIPISVLSGGRRLYDVIPGAIRLEMLPNTGHLAMEEKPERLVELLQEFLCDPSPSAAGRPGERSIDAPPALPQPWNTRTTP